MKKLCLLAVGFSFMFAFSAFASDFKFGVVDFQTIYKNSPSVKAESEKLNKQFKGDQNTIKVKQKELQTLMDQYKKNSSIMREQEKKDAEKKLTDKQNELLKLSQEYQQEVMEAQQKSLEKIGSKVSGVVASVAKKKNLDVVFPRNTLAYAKDGYDITKDVQKALK